MREGPCHDACLCLGVMHALRVMNIAQEMHLRGRTDCQVKSDVKVANKEKKCHSLLVYDVTYRAICCVITATGEGS